MTLRQKHRTPMRWIRIALAACLAFAVACGGETGSSHGGETHWLRPCSESSECGGEFACSCGVCTRLCEVDAECADLGGDAVCGDARASEFASECSSAELAQNFCVAEGSLGSGGSAGSGSGGTGASSGSGGLDVDALNICQDVPDACDTSTCFAVCGVNVATREALHAEGFVVDPQPAPYGAVTRLGDVTLAARGSRWLVTEDGSAEPAAELVYPGLSGPLVAGDRVFLRDPAGSLLSLDLADPAQPEIDQRWAPEVDLTNPELPTPLARPYGVSRGELVFEVGHSVSFVDVNSGSPQEVACVELMESESGDVWYDLAHVFDDIIVQSVTNEEDNSLGFSIYDRDGDGEVVETLELSLETRVDFWQDRMVVYTDGDPARLTLYELSVSGATQLGAADFPEGASGAEGSGRFSAGLVVFEDVCDETGCAALDITSDPPFAEYRVDSALVSREACSGLVTATGDTDDFWLVPSLFPNERFAESPDVDCGPTEHVSWRAEQMAWSPDGTQLALFGHQPDSTPWLRIWAPGSDEATTLTPSADGDYGIDRLWWDADFLIGHTGIICDDRRDWLYLHDVTDPESTPLRVDIPGPMVDMDVSGGRIWVIGLDGPYDCALVQPEPPKTMWFLDLADPSAGFTEVALPEGSDPEQLHFAGGTLYLISALRIEVLDAEGELMRVVEYASPYDPATAASELGLFVRDPARIQYLAPGADVLASEAAECSESFPVAADSDFFYLSTRFRGGPHQVTAAGLTRAVLYPSGTTLEYEDAGLLPWGEPSPVVAGADAVAVMLPNEIMILR